MPLFDFKCLSCEHEFETLLKFSEINSGGNPTGLICPKCEQNIGFQKMISYDTNFHLKGNGWYKDSYDGKSNRKE